jgi:Peptidase family S41
VRAVEHLQLDPLVVIARSQDLMLHSRVIDYQPDFWAELAYQQRKFFDWGGWLAVRPMDELPH